MKKILLTAAAVFAFSFANAQDTKFGMKAGLDNLSFSGGGDSITGFFIGGSAEFGLADKVALQPGLNYHSASKNGANLSYLSIPVLFKYNAADKIDLVAGPALFYNMDSNATDKSSFSLNLGGAYNITENLSIEPTYSLGLTGDVKANRILIGLGYKF
jgi:opacity protein-like surface antigen